MVLVQSSSSSISDDEEYKFGVEGTGYMGSDGVDRSGGVRRDGGI